MGKVRQETYDGQVVSGGNMLGDLPSNYNTIPANIPTSFTGNQNPNLSTDRFVGYVSNLNNINRTNFTDEYTEKVNNMMPYFDQQEQLKDPSKCAIDREEQYYGTVIPPYAE